MRSILLGSVPDLRVTLREAEGRGVKVESLHVHTPLVLSQVRGVHESQ